MTTFGRAIACALVGAAALLAGAAGAEPVKVKIDTGVLVGSATGDVVAFRGIPYVAPPLGELRWAPPAPAAGWTGERAADKAGPACPQPMHADGSPNEGGAFGPTSEDCLTLNVFAPKGAAKAPVMLWIHGGSNVVGAGSLGVYDGTSFARDGVILVSINYRLGMLGFFAHPALTKAAKPGQPLIGYAILDQIAALQWVQRNIAAFGGDPANVTVFGESAGGGDTLTLLSSPLAKGLFAKAIVESGGGWFPPADLTKREVEGIAAAMKAGAPENATIEQLRALPVAAIVANGGQGANLATEGHLLLETPAQAFAAGHEIDVPMMIGSNSFEASLMDTFHIPPAAIIATTPDTVKAAYADLPNDDAKAHAIFTDEVMGAPARWLAAKASAGKPVWLYHFSYVLDVQRPFAKGAGHASELPYVFDSWETVGALRMGAPVSDADQAVTRQVHSCWVAFAKTGVPVCAGAPAWPAYTPQTDTLMEFDGKATPTAHFRKAQLDAEDANAMPTLVLK